MHHLYSKLRGRQSGLPWCAAELYGPGKCRVHGSMSERAKKIESCVPLTTEAVCSLWPGELGTSLGAKSESGPILVVEASDFWWIS